MKGLSVALALLLLILAGQLASWLKNARLRPADRGETRSASQPSSASMITVAVYHL